MKKDSANENQEAAPELALHRFVRLLALYYFPNLKCSDGGLEGIWETFAVEGTPGSGEEVYHMRRVMIWDEKQKLGTIRKAPVWLLETYGHHIQRPLGKPNVRGEARCEKPS